MSKYEELQQELLAAKEAAKRVEKVGEKGVVVLRPPKTGMSESESLVVLFTEDQVRVAYQTYHYTEHESNRGYVALSIDDAKLLRNALNE